MRRLLCGALLVSGCFSPNGTSSTGASAGSTTSSASEPMSSTAETTPNSTSGESTANGTDSMSATQGVTTDTPTTGAITTMATTSTTDTTTTVSTTSTSNDTNNSMTGTDCNPPCGMCQTCSDGACMLAAPNTPCTPPDGACAAFVWGQEDKACYSAAPSSGSCTPSGECIPKCDQQGTVIVECAEVACVNPVNTCMFGSPSVSVTLTTLCATGGITTPACTTMCLPLQGSLVGYSCQDNGACKQQGGQDCNGFACDPNLLACKVICETDFDCASDFYCDLGQCKSF